MGKGIKVKAMLWQTGTNDLKLCAVAKLCLSFQRHKTGSISDKITMNRKAIEDYFARHDIPLGLRLLGQ